MTDVFKTFIKHMDGVHKAAVADAAAKAMAEHCDARIEKMRSALRDLLAWAERTKSEHPQIRTSRAIERARRALAD